MTNSNSLINSLKKAVDKIVIGQSSTIEQLLVALLSGGHVIVEGVPGTGKTLLVKVSYLQASPRGCPEDLGVQAWLMVDIQTSLFMCAWLQSISESVLRHLRISSNASLL